MIAAGGYPGRGYRQDEQMTGAARDLLLLTALIDIDVT